MMMDLLASTQIYVNHVTEKSHEIAQKVEQDETLDADEKDLQLEFLSDDIYSAKEAMDLAEELAIIGLYKTIELRINKAARASGLMSNNKIKELSAKGSLIKNFEAIGIDLKAMDFFDEFCELKLINNALKHTGIVSSDLANLNPTIWTKDQPITDFAAHFRRLLMPNIAFISNLGSELRSKL
ncbi:hypothetical protein J0V14_001267 [Vibrio parahaemolyticus]|nr:hypothetical protein [Vibrio parahaemolyticus]EJE4225394.1 hypothetical protein [Vibrio parahaemolyticus]